MEALSQKEQRVYDYIREVILKNGYAPSVRDIKLALGIKSTSTVHSYIERLEIKGYIKREQGKSRTLRIYEGSARRTVKFPVLARAIGGMPLLCDSNTDGYVDFPIPCEADGSLVFAVRVKGNELARVGLLDGDFVIVSGGDAAGRGEIAAVLDGEAVSLTASGEESGSDNGGEGIGTVLGKVIASFRYYQ